MVSFSRVAASLIDSGPLSFGLVAAAGSIAGPSEPMSVNDAGCASAVFAGAVFGFVAGSTCATGAGSACGVGAGSACATGAGDVVAFFLSVLFVDAVFSGFAGAAF